VSTEMKRRLGLLTIGQAPRDDIVPVLKPVLGNVQLEEAGALDDLSDDQIASLSPRPGEHVLVTRLRDAREVQLGGERIAPLLQDKLDRFAARGIQVVMLLCTGSFQSLNYEGLLLRPQRLLRAAVRAVAGDRRIGVLVPAREQLAEMGCSWRKSGFGNVSTAYASPYARPEELGPAVEQLVDGGAQLLVMDCVGYRPELKALARERSGLPVMLANTTAARIAAEVLA